MTTVGFSSVKNIEKLKEILGENLETSFVIVGNTVEFERDITTEEWEYTKAAIHLCQL